MATLWTVCYVIAVVMFIAWVLGPDTDAGRRPRSDRKRGAGERRPG